MKETQEKLEEIFRVNQDIHLGVRLQLAVEMLAREIDYLREWLIENKNIKP